MACARNGLHGFPEVPLNAYFVRKNLDYQRGIANHINAWLDSVEAGKHPVGNLAKENIRYWMPQLEKELSEFATDLQDSARAEYNNKLGKTIDELKKLEPHNAEALTEARNSLSFESFKRQLTLLQNCFQVLKRAAHNSIQYLEHHKPVTH